MASSCPPWPTADTERLPYDVAHERDFYKYFQPNRLGLVGQSDQKTSSDTSRPRTSPDRTLTAFAQLATLRLDCKRSFISFFDRNNQYIVAEATKSISLQADYGHEPGDHLQYGTCVGPKKGSICEHTIAIPSEFDEHNTDVSVLAVPDLRKDPRFKDQEYTIAKDFVFYAGTPIVSPNGYKIGSFCVVDDKPRTGIEPDQLAFMKDMATTIMLHMDLLRAQSESVKGERMVRGLGSFVEGKSSLEDWWMSEDVDKDNPASISPAANHLWASSQYAMHHGSSIATDDKTKPTWALPDSQHVLSTRRESFGSSDDASKPMVENPKIKKTSEIDSLPLEVKQTFSRASNIIRESLHIDAVCIFDATSRSTFGGLVDQAAHERPKRRKGPSTFIDTHGSRVDSETEASDSGLDQQEVQKLEDDKLSEILGFSTPHSSSVNGDESMLATDGMTESFLRSLLTRYPHGKILNFDESSDSSISTSSSQQGLSDLLAVPKTSTKKGKRLRSHEVKMIRRMFPGVRSLAVVPMWDANQKLFSACIAWTTDKHRILTSDSELSYLAAFADSITAEVSRINAKIADKAKSDFISSISHELRSPLHGILGSVECLQDSVLDPFQENLVHTMETCGKTLLDTIDHLLDFAKINNFTRKSTQRRTATNNPHEQKQNFALDVDVDLSVITEEVLETVFAGFDFVKSGQQLSDHMPDNVSPEQSSEKSLSNKHVSVVVDINKAEDSHWIFRTQAGAWRRVIMNIFGNSLKYTSSGYVQVKLEAIPLPANNKAGESEVTLTVTDSGKGMSEEYMSSHLFVPFAQEDSLQPGTGLGLAITSAIIKSMGGEIKVHSVKDKGTTVTVTLKMKHAPTSQESSEQSLISMACSKTKGLKIGFVGFGADSFKEEPEPDSPSPRNAFHLFMSSFHRMCKNWFQMDMHIMPVFDEGDVDVYLTTEQGLRDINTELAEHKTLQSEKDAQKGRYGKPLLVICNSVTNANAMMHNQMSHVSGVISQPCGPRKLAKALTLCLEQNKASKDPNKPAPTAYGVLNDGSNERRSGGDKSKKQQYQDEQPDGKIPDPPLKHPHKETLEIRPGRSSVPKDVQPSDVKSPPPTPISPGFNQGNISIHRRVCNVLAVDDNAINLNLLVTYIKKQGHAFATATNGLEALETYKARSNVGPSNSHNSRSEIDPPFDFVLMDLSMPIMDGLSSARHIRAYERASKIRPTTVIALTGLASASAQQEAFSSGIDTFMTKPVKLKELGRILDAEDGKKRDGDENQAKL